MRKKRSEYWIISNASTLWGDKSVRFWLIVTSTLLTKSHYHAITAKKKKKKKIQVSASYKIQIQIKVQQKYFKKKKLCWQAEYQPEIIWKSRPEPESDPKARPESNSGIGCILIKMSTRKCESGASRRKRRKLQESAAKDSLSIVQFWKPRHCAIVCPHQTTMR